MRGSFFFPFNYALPVFLRAPPGVFPLRSEKVAASLAVVSDGGGGATIALVGPKARGEKRITRSNLEPDTSPREYLKAPRSSLFP